MQIAKSTLTLFILLSATSGCLTSLHTNNIQPRETDWKHFVEVARNVTIDEYSQEDKGKKYYDALEVLGLTNYTWIHGPVLIAEGDRKRIARHPVPEVWKTDSQLLLASGDINGDHKPEYVLGAGWSGPMAGVLAVYDNTLSKIAELKTECIWDIELKDLTGDGTCEILCWEDQHHGSGLWQRRLTVLKYVKNTGLDVVWRGSTYDQAGDYLDIHQIKIDQLPGKPALIIRASLSQQWPQLVDNKTVIQRSKRREVVSYAWNKTVMHFEEQSKKNSEQDPAPYRLQPRNACLQTSGER